MDEQKMNFIIENLTFLEETVNILKTLETKNCNEFFKRSCYKQAGVILQGVFENLLEISKSYENPQQEVIFDNEQILGA